MVRETRIGEPKVRIADEPFEYLVEYVTHRDYVTSIVVNESTKGLYVTAQVPMPQQHCLSTVEVFNAAADTNGQFRLDSFLSASKPNAPCKKAKIGVDFGQPKSRKCLPEERQVEQRSVESDQRRRRSKRG